MKILLELIKSKAFPWILFGGALLIAFIMLKSTNAYLDVEQEYNRQLRGQLSEKERQLQSLNIELGVSRSDLITQKELAEKLKKDKEEFDKKFQAFVKEHNLQIKSRDRTIAKLKQKITGGDTVVIVPDEEGCRGVETRCIVSYSWEDTLKRFKLEDPNIFEQNNETFTSSQLFKIYGEVYEQKKGSLQIRRLVLREVYLKDGQYEPIPDGKAEIVDSQFDYSNQPSLPSKKIFNPRLIAVGLLDFPEHTTGFGLGAELLYYKQLGVSTVLVPRFDNLTQTKLMLGVEHSPKFKDLDLNLAIGVFVGSPVTEFEYTFSLGAIFYLSN